MDLGTRGLAGWTMVAMLTASLPPLAEAQTAAPSPPPPTASTKSAPSTTTTRPATTTTKPTATATAKPPSGAATTRPATAPAKTTSAVPARTTTGSAGTAKPATAPKTTGPAGAKPATAAPPSSQPAAQPKPPPPVPAAPKPAPPTPPPQATPLREATPAGSGLPGAPLPPVAGMPFQQRHPLVTGFLTGLLGVGLADALLGEEAPAVLPAGSVLEPVAAGLNDAEMAGQFTRLALFAGLVTMAAMLYRRRMVAGRTPGSPNPRSAPDLSAWGDLGRTDPAAGPTGLARPDDLKAIADEQDFADILRVVQAAWSEGDVMAMRGHITPDMADYFDRRLAQNVDNGIENRVVDVSDIRVERISDWEEEGVHYAKARMSWRALDYVIDLSKLPDEPGYIIDGSLEKPLDCEEVWTFAKSPDGAWVLCEVEQGASGIVAGP
jgi:predicted lipid-binding transport protein (Tim44 family)